MRVISYRPVLMAFLLIAAIVVFSNPVSAISSSDFEAGRIINNGVFTNKNAMSVSQVQAFLDSKMPNCDTNGTGTSPYYAPDYDGDGRQERWEYGKYKGNPIPFTCLNDYVENPDTQENNYGGGSVSGGKTAAEIIWQAGQNNEINPQVLLVTLQKESSLITDVWPFERQYDRAMGYGCPDTGPGNSANCNTNYYGFANQMNRAAWQFRRYLDLPENYNYGVGNRYIQYNPSSSCGGSTVFIETAATAALYNYTPYQPNQGSLKNYPGTASCGAYGNRNFWFNFNEWFGSTLEDPYPTIAVSGDWDGDGGKTIGLKRGNYYYLDNDNDGVEDITIGIGRVTDEVIIGDWDGNGTDDIGLRRGNKYYFDIDNDGRAEIAFGIGRTTDQALVGDWDGDSTDDIGLKRGNYYYLDTDRDNRANIAFGIGRTTDQALVGDWDGDSTDDIGLKRGNYYYLDTDRDNRANIAFGIGRTTDQALVGDWDGDSTDDIGLKRGNYYYLDTDRDNRANIAFGIGRTTDQALVGDWDGDSTDDIGLRRSNKYYFDTDEDGSAEISLIFGYF